MEHSTSPVSAQEGHQMGLRTFPPPLTPGLSRSRCSGKPGTCDHINEPSPSLQARAAVSDYPRSPDLIGGSCPRLPLYAPLPKFPSRIGTAVSSVIREPPWSCFPPP